MLGKIKKLSPFFLKRLEKNEDGKMKVGKVLAGYVQEPIIDVYLLIRTKCMKPDCKSDGEVGRFYLRNCEHIFCIGCLLEYLELQIKEKNKARIKCPLAGCPRRIHENDVRTLLDPDNEDLDEHLPSMGRRELLFEHDVHVIKYACRDQVNQCPRCMNFYMKKSGCNFTRCPNLYCNTWFCFTCGEPTPSWQHFTKRGGCMVSYDDLYTIIYLPRLLLFTESTGLFCMLPALFLLVYVFIPLFVLFGFPYYALKELNGIATRHGAREVSKLILYPIFILLLPFCFMISLVLSIGSFFTGFIILIVYIALTIIKLIPPVSKVMVCIDFLFTVTECCGLSDWKKIVQDTRDARKALDVDKIHQELEKSERIETIRMTPLEKEMREAEKRTAQDRKGRIHTGNAFADSPILSRFSKKKVEE